MSAQPKRYWLDERRGYVPLSEFPTLVVALRNAGWQGWAAQHPQEPSLAERARDIAERITGMPAYLVDDEQWAAAEAQAIAESEGAG